MCGFDDIFKSGKKLLDKAVDEAKEYAADKLAGAANELVNDGIEVVKKVGKVGEKVGEYIYDNFGEGINNLKEMSESERIIYPGYDYKRKDDGKIILPSIEDQINVQTTECKKTLVVFIGGAADGKYQPLLKNVFAPYEKAYGRGNERRQDVCYSEYGGVHVPPLMEKWFKANQKIVLVGHSWGGDRVVQLALDNSHINIDLLVTLDPVSYSFKSIRSKPDNVKRWINSYVQYKIKRVAKDFWKDKSTITNGNAVALVGHPWECCKGADNFIVNKNNDGTFNDISHADALEMFRNSGAENEVIKM